MRGPRGTAAKLAYLRGQLDLARAPAGAGAVERQHAKGKLTARERIEVFADPGSFVELGALARHRNKDFEARHGRPPGDGVVTGYATVDGRPVCFYAQDFAVFGGSLGEAHGEKIIRVIDHAVRMGHPVIGINDSGGARIQEGVVAQAVYGELVRRQVGASGVVPQISLIMGPCAGGAAYSPAVTDFTVMVEGTSHMFVTGPNVVRLATGEAVTAEELGGALTHNAVSGVAHYRADDDRDAIDYVRVLLDHLPSSNLGHPPAYPHTADLRTGERDRELDTLIPDADSSPYDMRRAFTAVLDDGQFLETQPLFAPNVITGFGRVEGRSVGVLANQPLHLAGCLDIDASEKAARFVRTCDAFNVPVLTFVDVPGFLPGVGQERQGIIRRGAKLSYAFAEATVPMITVITRKAFGGAYDVMGSKHLGTDFTFAWPTAQVAVLGAGPAVEVLHYRDLAAVADPQDREAMRRKLTDAYEQEMLNPYQAAARGYVDAVIVPCDTRGHIVRGLRALRTKRIMPPARKHGNIPL